MDIVGALSAQLNLEENSAAGLEDVLIGSRVVHAAAVFMPKPGQEPLEERRLRDHDEKDTTSAAV